MSLTDEDKKWVNEQLQGISTGLAAEFRQELKGLRTELTAEFNQRLFDMETKILTEFHKWASPHEARQRTHTATLKAIDLEM